jgi:hypothetical protein
MMSTRKAACLICSESQILMNERDCHAAFSDPAGYPFDGIVSHVSRRKNARQTRFQGKGLAAFIPRGEFTPGADISTGITFQFGWQPRGTGICADHHKQSRSFKRNDPLRLARPLNTSLNLF